MRLPFASPLLRLATLATLVSLAACVPELRARVMDASGGDDVAVTADAAGIDARADAPDVGPPDEGPDAPADDARDAAADDGAPPDACANTMCGEACVDLQTDLMNCGGCGSVCAAGVNARARCERGVCRVTCDTGFGNCDGEESDGCETNTNTTPAHCGMCGRRCSSANNAEPACNAGACGIACNPGFGNCDGNAANGCETNVLTTSSHCGGCGRGCAGSPNATAACVGGTCACQCNANFGNCNNDCLDGCETSLGSSVANCGMCGRACPSAPNATPTCNAGTCGIACRPGFANCDGNATNGCETNLALPTSCGACSRTCPASMPVCQPSGTSFDCATGCAPGLVRCGAMCVSTSTSATNCGGCGTVCATPPNAAPACSGGACTFTCNAGFANCDGSAANGCETNTATSATHCGTCNRPCAAPANATATCAGGGCGFTCNAGFANCNGLASDGCETSLNTTSSCGACGRSCPAYANSVASCTGGVCGITCNAGFGNCDGNVTNGCEASLGTTTNCGRCGNTCRPPANASATCSSGACGFRCEPLFGNCDGSALNGCETDLSSNRMHCGSCGRLCSNFAPYCCDGACSRAACL